MPKASPNSKSRSPASKKKTPKKKSSALTRFQRIFLERLLYAGSPQAVAQVFAENHKDGSPAYTLEECLELYALPQLQRQYKIRLEKEAEENARQMSRGRKLHDPSFLDAHVVENVEHAEVGSPKTSALKLGYAVTRGELAPKSEPGKIDLLDALFRRMNLEEMDAYAQDGSLPPWFTQETGRVQ